MSDKQTVTSAAVWEAVGAWTGGTVSAVAVRMDGQGRARGLFGGRAGLYAWADGAPARPARRGIGEPSIVAVAFAGNTALAASESGRLYRNTAQIDGEWREIMTWAGLGVPTVLTSSPDFSSDGALFVGTPTGIFRTLDGGQNWEACDFGLLDTETLCLVCAPDFAVSRLLWAGSAGGGLYRSRNAGKAWRESGMGLPDAPVQALAVASDFATSRTLYAGLEEHGVYVSRDGGDSWSRYGLVGTSVNCLTLAGDGRLLAGCNDGLYVRQAEQEWQRMDAPVQVVLALAAAGDTIALGAYGTGVAVSADGGRTWDAPKLPLHAPPLPAPATVQDWMAVDADGFLAHTADGGASWRTLPTPAVDGVFGVHGRPDASGQPVYFAATGIGLCRWNGDADWPLVADAPFHDHTALAVELSPMYAEDGTLLVVGHDGALLLSADEGATWREITGPWTGQTLLQAHFAPTTARSLLALSAQPTESGHFAITIWESEDAGQNWKTLAGLTSGVPAVLTCWPQDGTEQAIFLATQHRIVKIYRPLDAAEHAVHQHFFAEGTRVTALAASLDYAADGVLWAATGDELFRSSDRGLTWQATGGLPEGSLPLVALWPAADRLTALTLGGQVWRRVG